MMASSSGRDGARGASTSRGERKKPLERFLLYESRTKYYLVGHTSCRSEWYMLQLSRQEHNQAYCDNTAYSENQMKGVLASLHAAMDQHGGLKLVMKAYGVIGVIMLIKNAYLILVTHRTKVGTMGGHRIYGCRDVAYVPILSKEFTQAQASESAPSSAGISRSDASGSATTSRSNSLTSSLNLSFEGVLNHVNARTFNVKSIMADEKRYLRLFMGVDLCKEFYFSYTYRLWNTLQQNLLLDTNETGGEGGARGGETSASPAMAASPTSAGAGGGKKEAGFGGTSAGFESMFVWNCHLANHYFGDSLEAKEKERWMVPLIHGFFDQVKLSSAGKQLKVSLLARRSRYFAGTRFLKRGINELGQVANEVETEQICEAQLDKDLHLAKSARFGESDGAPALPNPNQSSSPSPEALDPPLRMSSIVQLRGSIPLYWSQETSTSLNPRPEIRIRRYDPSYRATRAHFDRLHSRYGKPVIVLNLIKSFEKRPREMILRVEFAQAVDYLNRFYYKPGLGADNWASGSGGSEPSQRAEDAASGQGRTGGEPTKPNEVLFVHWDFSKCTKQRGVNVLNAISPVVTSALKSTGLFYCLPSQGQAKGRGTYDWGKQEGVLRTNCIDCLDRTNVAQFAYGLYALSHQMHVLGITRDEEKALVLNPASVVATELMNLYEAMGDCLAYQYGGSEAHSKFFKRQKGSWEVTTQSKDMMTSFRRFYSNTYTDAARQAAINLFLGHFLPNESPAHIWDLDSDSYLPGLYYDDDHAREAEWRRKPGHHGDSGGGGGGGGGGADADHGVSRSGASEAEALVRNLGTMAWHDDHRTKAVHSFTSIDRVIEQAPLRINRGFCDFDKSLGNFRSLDGLMDDGADAEEASALQLNKRLEHMLHDIHWIHSQDPRLHLELDGLHFCETLSDPTFVLKDVAGGSAGGAGILFPAAQRSNMTKDKALYDSYCGARGALFAELTAREGAGGHGGPIPSDSSPAGDTAEGCDTLFHEYLSFDGDGGSGGDGSAGGEGGGAKEYWRQLATEPEDAACYSTWDRLQLSSLLDTW